MFNFGFHMFHKKDPWVKGAQWDLAPTVFGKYLGGVMKGWWHLGTSGFSNYFAVEFAIGGEDNMVQFKVVLPYLGCWAIGVRVPRWLTRGWVYERRELTFRSGYIGRWFEVLVGVDQGLDGGMARYYREKRKAGEKLSWSRAALWPGWHLKVGG